MLITLKEILQDAESRGYAVGLFNMLNLEMARGIIEAAEEMRSPLILGVAEVHLPFIPLEFAAPIMRQIAQNASVPVCLHFDHGVEFSKIFEVMRQGFTSVMYDGSSLPYDQNVENTREIVHVAHALGISVEAELGKVGGAESSTGGGESHEEDYTKPAQVADFIEKTDIDALAVAIGTAHGPYTRPPVLDINRLAEIYKVSSKPLVLHGGSGLSDNDFRNTIENGIRKVNICTEMCRAAQKTYAYANEAGVSFELSTIAAKDIVKEVVRGKMELFGSMNKC